MSDPQPLATPFPGPPSFYQSFTEENLETLRKREDEAAEGRKISSADLPEELQNLRPPTPPVNGEYFIFGESHSLDFRVPPIPPDERILPPPSDPAQKIPTPSPQNLLTVTRSLLLSYLELLHLLIANPAGTEYGPKWEDIRDLFRNAHSILNSYRDWQSREALIGLMEEQIEKGSDSSKHWDSLEKSVDELLQGILKDGVDEADIKRPKRPGETRGNEKKTGELKRMWDLIEDDFEA